MNDVRPAVVVGGGAGGALVSIQLLTAGWPVVLVDPGATPGRGVAYGTASPWHLLDSPVEAMTALPGKPDDFLRWCRIRCPGTQPSSFVPRGWYGQYLSETLCQNDSQLTVHRATASRIFDGSGGESIPVTMTFILDGPDATVVADRLASALNESASAWPATEVTVHHPDVIVDLAAREVYVESERVHLTRREFDLLLHLTQNPGIAFTRLQLLRMVWQHEYSGERTVDVHVRRLRVKLGIHGAQITTLHGFGYRLEPSGRFTTRP